MTRPSRSSFRAAVTLAAVALAAVTAATAATAATHPLLEPVDAQNWVDQGVLTWADYRPVPDRQPQYYDGSATGSQNQYRTAIILMDFKNQPFLITQPAKTHPFGNPQPGWTPVPQSGVNAWMQDYYGKANQYNGGHTLHSYWMETTHGRIGVTPEVFGPYTMPYNSWQFGLGDFGQNSPTTNMCPAQASIPTGGTAVTSLNVSTTAFFYVGDKITVTHDTLPASQRPNPSTSTRIVTSIPDSNTLVLDQPIATVVAGARTHDCGLDIRTEGANAWRAAIGCASGLCGYDNGFYVTAGHDESSTWQEFGEMLYEDREDVPEAFGNPNPALTNWSVTRYVPWTSWLAASSHWPNAGGGTSTQAESSGLSVFAHEFSHLRNLPDNYNNPFADNQRNYTGYWEMMSRGTFNGPGGTHNRWQIPNAGGSALGPHHTLHFKNRLNVLTADEQVTVERNTLQDQGVAVVPVKARESVPAGDFVGLTLNFGTGGDLAGSCANQGLDSFNCPGTGFLQYRVEVVDRVGNDSFVPGHGVLLTKSKISGTPSVWMIDPNPQDIGMIDFFRPDGTPVAVVRGDPRQLNDATFHAGTESGSEFEYVDTFNSLHFYVLRKYRNAQGVLFYDVAFRRTTGAGPFARNLSLAAPSRESTDLETAKVVVPLTNTGEAGTGLFDSDVYRLSASIEGAGWSVRLPYEVVSAKAGQTVPVNAIGSRVDGSADVAKVTLTATSETDPSKTQTVTLNVYTPAGAASASRSLLLSYNLDGRVEHQLKATLDDVAKKWANGNAAGACDRLDLFVTQVNEREAGKRLTAAQAAALRDIAAAYSAAMAC
jgi:M6 family metalloprotease-like protein